MKRFLFKFFFVLMALIAAIPAQAATIYFKNTVGWSTVYVHFYNAECWDNQGTGSKRSEHVSVQQMSLISGTDIYSCEYTGNYSVVAFTKEEQKDYYGFHGNEVVYRTDFSTSKPLFTPDNGQPASINNCTYYNQGTWSEYSLLTQLAAPTFSPEGGTYTDAQSVTISAADGATIYYTIDGSDPTSSSTKYEGAITISTTTTLKAIAVKDGYANSAIASATYTINTSTSTTGKIYVPVSEYDKSVAYIYSWDANNDNYKLFGSPGTQMTQETVNGVKYWTVTVELSKLPATVTGWILHNGKWGDKANDGDLPGVTFQDGYVYHINGTSEEITYINAPTFSPEGGEITSAQSVTISAAEGATIYYTTDDSDPTTSSSVYSEPITVNATTTIKAIAVKDGYTSKIATATYTLVEPECWYLPDASTTNAVQMTRNADGSFSLTIDIEADKKFLFSKKNSTATADILGSTAGSNSDYWVKEDKLDHDITLVSGTTQKFIMKAGAGSYKITVSADYSKVKLVKSGAQAGGIPVFPLGVNSEAELSAYKFEANPVYYLLSTVLNNNRVTPEWQMTKGADGLYHLNGFAMRNTYCRDIDGGKNIEGYIKVRQYVDATSYVEYDKQQLNTLPENPLTEGKLYNATFNPSTQELTLTEDASAKGKMPFISLVGYMMQQDQEYITPRGIDKKPEGTTTAMGWQEAWLQYDANGKLLKDRAGNVMYSTTWPPKNPIYFTATVGDDQRLYSSDQMTFVPVKDAEGNYVAKKGSDWEKELKALDSETYKNLDLVDDNIYYRYVVSDIWYVGAGKIWTGWGSQITNSDKGVIAQWYNHTNWGYSNKRADDTDGTPIAPETTYGVSTDDKANGNFLFEEPTYFKTFEFFYENNKPSTESKIYTTKAYGSASIAAQNVKEGDSYKKGSYQPTVSVPEGVTITGWTITRHDATTDVLAPIGSDNGLVASGEAKDPSTTTFTLDNEGLGEGRYYYELVVTFSNGRTSTVRSNPFVIYFPNQYSLDANGYQLVKLETAIDGYDYVTYNAKANGDLYFVKFTDNTVSKFRVATSAERESLNGKFAKNEGIKWTDKVFVYAPVPSEFKIDAEKASATVSLDQIYNYDVNNTKGVAPVRYELAVVDNKQNFADKVYKAVMNYKEKDATTGVLGDMKSSLGKENLTVMRMPNVKGGDVTVTVTPTANSEELTINYNGTEKNYAANYYNVNVELPFSDPNVEVDADNAPQYDVKVGDITTRYKADEGNRSVTISNVNPLDFAGKKVEVNAVYYDGSSYALTANIGEAAVMEAPNVAFESVSTPDFSVDAISSYLTEDGVKKPVVVVTKMATSYNSESEDKIGGNILNDGDCLFNVDFFVNNAETAAYSIVENINNLNWAGELKTVTGSDGKLHHVWSKSIQFYTDNYNAPFKAVITPFYVAKVTNETKVTGLTGATQAAPAEVSYVALLGNPAEDSDQNNGLPTGIVDITEGSNMKAYKVIENGEIRIIYGDRKFNVMGAEVK